MKHSMSIRHMGLLALSAISLSGLVACSGKPKLPEHERKVQYTVESRGLKATDAYARAKTWFFKTSSDQDWSIKLDDQTTGHIVGKGAVRCNELRKAGDVNDYKLYFMVDIKAEPNRTHLVFEDLEIKPEQGKSSEYRNIDSVADLEKIKKGCLKPVHGQYATVMSKKYKGKRGIASKH